MGGRLALFKTNWRRLSEDPWIQQTVEGSKVEFLTPPHQNHPPREIVLEAHMAAVMTEEIENLAAKNALIRAPREEEGFMSAMFLVPRTDGSWHPVLNLKPLNCFVVTPHFKMESARSVKNLNMPGDWLVKLDLKDAYLTVPIHHSHQHFLRFQWKGTKWQFRVLPFGLSSAPCTFTKVMKPVVASLRRLGIRLIVYLDDMLILDHSKERLLVHLASAMKLLISLGFLVNLKKSVLSPTRKIEFLGFLIDSVSMRLSLPRPKVHSIVQLARRMVSKDKVSLRELARAIGMMVAAQPAILPAPLHYRFLESAKSWALKCGLSYETQVMVTQDMKKDLDWWISSVTNHNGRVMEIPQWHLVIESDASKRGWGACSQGTSTGGPWTEKEQLHSINYLKLLAAFLGLQTFASSRRDIAVLLRIDNVTAIAYVNKMGGPHSGTLSGLALVLWEWCLQRNILIHAEHLPGRENVHADWESRHVLDSSDWKLEKRVFGTLDQQFGPLSIDLFASRTNHQLPVYCSWRPDPSAWAVDALAVLWGKLNCYMFPPFSLIPRCLSKLRAEKALGLLVAPVWPNQVWYPQLLRALVDTPALLPSLKDIITDPTGQHHPLVLEGHLPLAAWPVSGDSSSQKAFRMELSTSSASLGETPQKQHT